MEHEDLGGNDGREWRDGLARDQQQAGAKEQFAAAEPDAKHEHVCHFRAAPPHEPIERDTASRFLSGSRAQHGNDRSGRRSGDDTDDEAADKPTDETRQRQQDDASDEEAP
jgi:hypothetical protein